MALIVIALKSKIGWLLYCTAFVIELCQDLYFNDKVLLLLKFLFFTMALVGVIFWFKESEKPKILHTPPQMILPLLSLAAGQTFMLYFLFKYFELENVVLASLLTSIHLTLLFMMAKKWVESWVLLAIIQCIYVLQYFNKDQFILMSLMALVIVVCVAGFIIWNKQIRLNQDH